jgi:tetratricopeptide (TPR) repeat protein
VHPQATSGLVPFPPIFPSIFVATALAAALACACATPPPHSRAVEQVRRGYEHLAGGRREQAEVAFEHALEIAPDLPEARVGLAVALRSDGRAAEALLHLDHAAGVDPELAEAHADRGEALAALGRDAEALAAFDEALRIDPDQVPARVDRARLLARRAVAGEGDARGLLLDRARRDLLHALESGPGTALVHQDLGWIELQRGDADAAASSYLRAASLDPASAPAWLGACVALALRGACVEAAAACRRCAASPTSPEVSSRCASNLAALPPCAAEGPAANPGKAKGAPARAGAPSGDPW